MFFFLSFRPPPRSPALLKNRMMSLSTEATVSLGKMLRQASLTSFSMKPGSFIFPKPPVRFVSRWRATLKSPLNTRVMWSLGVFPPTAFNQSLVVVSRSTKPTTSPLFSNRGSFLRRTTLLERLAVLVVGRSSKAVRRADRLITRRRVRACPNCTPL